MAAPVNGLMDWSTPGAAPANALLQVPPILQPGADNPFLAQAPTLADAWQHNVGAVQDWAEQQRQDGVAKGLINPDTGELTKAGQQHQAVSIALGFVGGGLEAAPMRGPAGKLNDLLMPGPLPQASSRLLEAAAAHAGLSGAQGPEMAGGLESRSKFLYNAPNKPPRPFDADYPAGATADATGRLTADIEGRPLGASFIAGRSTLPDSGVENAGGAADGNRMGLAGGDQAVSPAEFDALSEATIGSRPQAVAAGQISGDAGRFTKTADPTTGNAVYNIYTNRTLSPVSRAITTGHELGHMVDELSGQIPTTGLSRELSQVYNTMTTGQERTRHLTRPSDLGYDAESAPREQMASAIHAYLTNPNYLKTVAPKTAAAIRAAVNANPRLRDWIQFNGAAGLAGAAAAGDQPSQ